MGPGEGSRHSPRPVHPRPPPCGVPRRRGLSGGRQVAPCVHSVHGERGRPRARLRRPVWSAAEGVPRPRLHHQLHPGRRSSSLRGPVAGWLSEGEPACASGSEGKWGGGGQAAALPRGQSLPGAEAPWAEPSPSGGLGVRGSRRGPGRRWPEAGRGLHLRDSVAAGRCGVGGQWRTPSSAAHAPRPQVHGQVLYTASHDGALRLWDVRGLPRAPPLRPAAPKRSLSRLFSNKVGCAAAAPLQPA